MTEVVSGSGEPSKSIDITQLAQELGLPETHPAVVAHARALSELKAKNEELQAKDEKLFELKKRLDDAEKDPLTGFWLRGPGFRQVEEFMSIVENNLAGLNDNVDGAEDAPNALMAIGLDLEGLHYTNIWHGQRGGDARLIRVGSELREAADIVRQSARMRDRRAEAREGEDRRKQDLLIRTGGDELMAVLLFRETDENTKTVMTERITQRLSRHKLENAPNMRIIYRVGFFEPGIGQTPEDLYHSVEPKAAMSRKEKLARPIFKIVRLGLGQYRPPTSGEL
jgi:GGDEF domain-containing protein